MAYGKKEDFVLNHGDLIFFDWADELGNRDGNGDHVGIVEKVEDGMVHTIEGNTGDTCDRRQYELNSLDILGYGTPMYK